VNIKKLQRHPPLKLSLNCGFSFVANPCGDELSSPSFLTSPKSHTQMYIIDRLSSGKCNMILSCDKSLCNVLNCWIAFMMHKNAQANLTHVHLNVMKHWQDSKSTPPPPPTKAFNCQEIDFGYQGTSTSLEMCLHSTTHLHGFYMDGIKLYNTWMISGTSQCLHRKSTPG